MSAAMEINNNLAGLVGQSRAYDNGTARVRDANVDAATIAPTSAIYHGSMGQAPDIGYDGPKDYTIKIESRVSESAEAYSARMSKMFDLITKQLGDTSIDLKHAYDWAMNTLPAELKDKDWGFSVSDGTLTLWEDTDKLSESERETIKSAFSDFSIEYLSNKVADTLVAALKAERGPQKTTQGIGKYDLTEENFGEIIDLRAYLESHTEGGKYASMTTALKNPNDDSGVYFVTGIMAMIDQLSARAEAKFAEHG